MIVSLALETIPGLKKAWAGWEWKRLALLAAFVLVPVAAWVLVCSAGLDIGVAADCTAQGLLEWAVVGLMAFTGSQATYVVKARGLAETAGRK
jgi:hypothetical protein